MSVVVEKRDGNLEGFNVDKIKNAIIKAMDDDGGDIDEDLANSIASSVKSFFAGRPDAVTVEEIQDEVERKLMASRRKNAAKAYIIYRDHRTIHREMNSEIFKKVIRKTEAEEIENANANVDEKSFGGRKQEASNIVQKELALSLIMSKDVAKAHNDGYIYQHDLDSFGIGMHNCLFIDMKNALNGFRTKNGDVRAPKSYSTACQQTAVAFQAQSQVQFGGVGTVHLDYDLAPFIKPSFYKYFLDGLKYVEHRSLEEIEEIKAAIEVAMPPIDASCFEVFGGAKMYADDMLAREVRQSAESLYHNLNTLESRAGSQVPFSSINFGRDTSVEGRMVSRSMMNASLAGIGEHHLTSIFPISIFQYKQGVNANPEDPNYDLKQLAIKSLSKRIYPNFANCDWSQAHEDENDPDTYFATMGKRKLQPI